MLLFELVQPSNLANLKLAVLQSLGPIPIELEYKGKAAVVAYGRISLLVRTALGSELSETGNGGRKRAPAPPLSQSLHFCFFQIAPGNLHRNQPRFTERRNSGTSSRASARLLVPEENC
jgi:hypothetical protein